MRLDRTSTSLVSLAVEDESPRQQFRLHSRADLGAQWEWDTTLYYVDRLEATDIAAYLRLDMRLGWRPREAIDLSVVAQNLLDHSHAEFVPIEGIRATEVPRGVYGMLTWRF